jgi:hypothetical protein
VLGLALTAAALNATGTTTDFLAISILRAFAGAAGFGMAVSAFAVPTLIATGGWQMGWLAPCSAARCR